MADIHIEEFYKDLAKILLHLHNAFPRKSQIFVEDISGADNPDEYGLHSKRHQSCFSAMLWLADEDFIRYEDTIRQEAIDQAVLTQKTFIRLNRLACLPAHNSTVSISSSLGVNDTEQLDNGTDQSETNSAAEPSFKEPLTNVQLIRNTLRSATSTRLALVLENILFTD